MGSINLLLTLLKQKMIKFLVPIYVSLQSPQVQLYHFSLKNIPHMLVKYVLATFYLHKSLGVSGLKPSWKLYHLTDLYFQHICLILVQKQYWSSRKTNGLACKSLWKQLFCFNYTNSQKFNLQIQILQPLNWLAVYL